MEPGRGKPKPRLELEVLYRDDSLAAVSKPSGMLVHRGWGRDRVVAMGLAREALGRWVYPVHRLDRGTSGLLLFALRGEIARRLQRALEAGAIRKRYLGLVRGIAPQEGTIEHPIPNARGARRPAVTRFRRLATFERYSLLELRPLTGRLHQIRRHLKHVSHPLIGDVRYGKGEHNRLFRRRFGLHRLALHASGVELDHPATGEPLSLSAAVPADLAGPLRAMGLDAQLWNAEPDDAAEAVDAEERAHRQAENPSATEVRHARGSRHGGRGEGQRCSVASSGQHSRSGGLGSDRAGPADRPYQIVRSGG